MSRQCRSTLSGNTPGRKLTVVLRWSKGLAKRCRARSGVKEQPGGSAAGYGKGIVRDGTSWRRAARGGRRLSNRYTAMVDRGAMILAFVDLVEEANL
jgi:hypothetical protein